MHACVVNNHHAVMMMMIRFSLSSRQGQHVEHGISKLKPTSSSSLKQTKPAIFYKLPFTNYEHEPPERAQHKYTDSKIEQQ